MNSKLSKEDCILLLREKSVELQANGVDRFPQRSDFSDREVVAIKAFLGPWPRALETAGLKEIRDDGKAERVREKRIRAKKRKTEAKRFQNELSEEEK